MEIPQQSISKERALRDFPQAPKYRATMLAGPAQTHQLGDTDEEEAAIQREITAYDRISHRSNDAKQLLAAAANRVFALLGIPQGLRNTEFRGSREAPAGYHVGFTTSGSEGMARAIRALCPPDGTLLVHTDNFSGVASEEMNSFGRGHRQITLPRGEALVVDSEQFEEIAGDVEKGHVRTLYLTENATTTGAYQPEAVAELVRRRNEAESPTVIVVDSVSSQIFGREWTPQGKLYLADAFFWAGQKDVAIKPGIGTMVFNQRALARELELQRIHMDTGGKLGLMASYGTNEKRMTGTGQTPQTPGLGDIARQLMIFNHVLRIGADGKQPVREHIAWVQNHGKQQYVDDATQGRLADLGFKLTTSNPALQSPTSIVMKVPTGVSASAIIRAVAKATNILIASGYGDKYKETEIRVGRYSATSKIDDDAVREAIADETQKLFDAVV